MNYNYKDIILRYLILLTLAFSNLYLFYLIFTPLTVYPVFWILDLISGSSLLGNTIVFKGNYIELIPACIAGAAYYLLFILNLTTPMSLDKRIKSLIFINFTFLLLNIARIILFAVLLISGYQYFNFAHTLVWYFGSTVLVVIVWFVNVKFFNISSIPVYTDLANLYKLRIKKTKRKNTK